MAARSRVGARPGAFRSPDPSIGVRKHGVRRRLVLEVAARLFVEQGYSRTSIEEIGNAAGVTGPAVYRHFASKQALLTTLIEEGCARLTAATAHAGTDPELSPEQALTEMVDAYVGFLAEHHYLAIISEDSMSAIDADVHERVMRISRRFRARMIAAYRLVRPEFDEPTARFAVNSVVGMCRNAIRTRSSLSPGYVRRRLLEQSLAVLSLPAPAHHA